MILRTKLKERAVDYCNAINPQIVAGAIITHYTRIEGNFIPDTHSLRKDKLGGRTSGCGCDYCTTLHKYVRARLVLHHLKNQLYKDYFYPPLNTLESLNQAIDKQYNYCLKLRHKLVKLGETMKVPNSIKRKKKYEKSEGN